MQPLDTVCQAQLVCLSSDWRTGGAIRRDAAVVLQQEKCCGAGLNHWAGPSGRGTLPGGQTQPCTAFRSPCVQPETWSILNCGIKCLRHQAIYLKDKEEILEKFLMENSHSWHSGYFFHPCSPTSPSPCGLHFHILPLVSNQVRTPWGKGYVFLGVGMMLSPKGLRPWQGCLRLLQHCPIVVSFSVTGMRLCTKTHLCQLEFVLLLNLSLLCAVIISLVKPSWLNHLLPTVT